MYLISAQVGDIESSTVYCWEIMHLSMDVTNMYMICPPLLAPPPFHKARQGTPPTGSMAPDDELPLSDITEHLAGGDLELWSSRSWSVSGVPPPHLVLSISSAMSVICNTRWGTPQSGTAAQLNETPVDHPRVTSHRPRENLTGTDVDAHSKGVIRGLVLLAHACESHPSMKLKTKL